MSMPNIPNISPCINISFEDSINLLLTSIALEEISLSELMDAEKNKLLYVINDCRHKDSALHDAIIIDKSVNETIQNMIKLQMLLQFKLEHVKEIIPCTITTCSTTTSTSTTTTCTRSTTTHSTTTATSTHTTTTTTVSTTTSCTRSTTTRSTTTATVSHTTTCTTQTCSTTTQCPCPYRLRGKGRGCVSNACDKFYLHPATLQALISSGDMRNRYIRYFVQNGCESLYMKAFSYNIRVQKQDDTYKNSFVAYGKCHVERDSQYFSDLNETAYFKLIVREAKNERTEFMMQIVSEAKPELNHNSGFVQIKGCDSDLYFYSGC